MCGIGGIMMFPKERSDIELRYIRELVTSIGTENQVRGHDATGFVTFSRSGANLFKYPMEAKTLVKSEAYKKFISKNINKNTKNILIHTRAGTKGSEQNNDNNHPIESQRFIGVHNGMIWNDDSLFKKHKLFRQAEVDSEVIFRLLDKQGTDTTVDNIKYVAEQLKGSFTTAFVPKNKKTSMYIVRNDNPITLIYIHELNIIAFASMKYYLINAINEANVYSGEVFIDIESDCVFDEPVRESIYEFNTLLPNALEQLSQKPTKFKENYSYNWYDENYHLYGGLNGRGYDEEELFTEENTTREEEETKEGTFISIMSKLSIEEMDFFDAYLEEELLKSWNEGWSKGRESLGEEMAYKINLAHEVGARDRDALVTSIK
jgi:hypothetical protein